MLPEPPIDDIVSIFPTTVEVVTSQTCLFMNTVSSLQCEHPEWVVLLLGTSWMTGYQAERHAQASSLKSLMKAILAFLQERGLTFLFGDEAEVSAWLSRQRHEPAAGYPRVVGAVGPERTAVLRCCSTYVCEVSDFLTIDSYFPVLPVLTIALRAAFNLEISQIQYPNVVVKWDRKVPLIIPKIEPRDYLDLEKLYHTSASLLCPRSA